MSDKNDYVNSIVNFETELHATLPSSLKYFNGQVGLVYLLDLVHLVSFVQLNKLDRLDKSKMIFYCSVFRLPVALAKFTRAAFN